jgi:hypothetical protein
MNVKNVSTGQPAAPKRVGVPTTQKSGQGRRVEMINLERYVPPGFQALDLAVQGLLHIIGEDEQKYNAAITTLIQRWMGIDDQITEIAIKGVSRDGEKYKIVLRST